MSAETLNKLLNLVGTCISENLLYQVKCAAIIEWWKSLYSFCETSNYIIGCFAKMHNNSHGRSFFQTGFIS